MRKAVCILSGVLLLFMSCSHKIDNPFFSEFDTPFGTPAFDKIKDEHYLPAFKAGLEQDSLEVIAVADNPAEPTFANTIEALEGTGEMLSRVSSVFYNMLESNTNDSLQNIAKTVAPLLSKHSDDILMNAKLFQRVKAVYDQKDQLGLNPEQMKLLEKNYKEFVRGGANLDDSRKTELRKINEELSVLSLKFGDNILAEDNAFELVIENPSDLAGLPQSVITAASETATERGKSGKWVFTLQAPSIWPFLQYSERRDLREKIFKAYASRGNHDNDLDNKVILTRIAALRLQRANLLGYATHADFILEENMAKNPAAVYNLLDQLWQPALKRSQNEAKDLQKMLTKEAKNLRLKPWDWFYYTEKLRKEKYDLDDEALRPYFDLEKVRNGAFDVATKLWGITFTERTDIPKYHDDVKVFEVKEADGSHIGILYVDYFPRASKGGGAWMSNFREQKRKDGKNIAPIIVNVYNFTKPTSDKPSLLTLDEVETLFHEFGHALHGLFSNCSYKKISGTNVSRDFVEVPSQIMENWATHPEVMKSYAKHYQTGEPIPDELIEKIKKSERFNMGFISLEYLAASILDMNWHTITQPETDAITFEDQAMAKIGLIPEIIPRYKSYYFRHIFAGGYSAGYYAYIWAEVLDADAFQAFEEKGLFDQATAKSFRDNILSKGGAEDPMVLYKRFRGSEPKIDALLERRGLK
ncbi:MAG: M3 family metallopeptidase [Candidatus Marinimicrobia bacterium]|nr:M3 family metallopeptidase [Candidatus Neomarinimicrobiota bacterium]